MDAFPRRKRLRSAFTRVRQSTDTFAWARRPTGSEQIWPELIRRIGQGRVIPVISNWFRVNRVFDIDYDNRLGLSAEITPDEETSALTIDEELAELWAEAIGYPLPDKHQMSRVALYNRVRAYDADQANMIYLDFLKRCLLDLATADESVAGQVDALRRKMAELSFSAVAAALNYPRFNTGQEDPLRLLAKLPLPIYVTTSHHDFMERALHAEAKTPQTQVCFWSGEPAGIAPEHQPGPDYSPTVEHPLVYHLFGFEPYPTSLVLSEDDYFQFLIKVLQSTHWNESLIPHQVRAALVDSSLLLLGYRPEGWDFKVLLQGLINTQPFMLRSFSLVTYLDPGQQPGAANLEITRRFWEAYHESAKLKVEWSDADSFIQKLWQEWTAWKGSEQP